MVADSRHREKNSKSRKNFHNQGKKNGIHNIISESKKKNYEIEKKSTESRKKKLKSRKIFWN